MLTKLHLWLCDGGWSKSSKNLGPNLNTKVYCPVCVVNMVPSSNSYMSGGCRLSNMSPRHHKVNVNVFNVSRFFSRSPNCKGLLIYLRDSNTVIAMITLDVIIKQRCSFYRFIHRLERLGRFYISTTQPGPTLGSRSLPPLSLTSCLKCKSRVV